VVGVSLGHDISVLDTQHFLRLQGRQLFERDKNLEDGILIEEGTISVDISQYERARIEEEQEESERVTFSDSD
jgi:hypothetical protein